MSVLDPLASEAGTIPAAERLWVSDLAGGSHVTALPLCVAGLTVREPAALECLAAGLNLEVAPSVGGTMGSCFRASAALRKRQQQQNDGAQRMQQARHANCRCGACFLAA